MIYRASIDGECRRKYLKQFRQFAFEAREVKARPTSMREVPFRYRLQVVPYSDECQRGIGPLSALRRRIAGIV